MNVKLTTWLKDYAEGKPDSESAIRLIGTNGFPYLLDMIFSTDSAPKKRLVRLLSKQSVLEVNSALSRQLLASKGFEALGAAANGAVPELARALNQPSTSRGAALALAGIGSEEAMEPLLRALRNDNKVIRANSALALAQLGNPSTSAVMALCKVLEEDKEHSVRFAAAEVLGGFTNQASILVPALVKGLSDESPAVRYAAVRGLGQMGSKAFAVLPEVRKATNDAAKLVREEATRALGKIVSNERITH